VRNLGSLLAAAFLLFVATPCGADEPTPSPEPTAPPSAEAPVVTEPLQLAITPAWAHSLLASSVSAEGIGLGIDVFPGRGRRRIGVSLVGALYEPFSREQAAAPSHGPMTETAGWATAEVRVVALKTRSVELHFTGGVGVVETRPVSLVDRGHRHFDFDSRLGYSTSAALRVALTRGVFLSLELRDVIYVEQRENLRIDAKHPENPQTWFGDKLITNMVEPRIGLTFLLFPEPS
jgi:hypothetical protein